MVAALADKVASEDNSAIADVAATEDDPAELEGGETALSLLGLSSDSNGPVEFSDSSAAWFG